MTDDGILHWISTIGVVPVVILDDAADAAPLADALLAGGLYCAEVTLRTPAGERAIEAMASRVGLLVGAGTVLETDQVDRCTKAGAQFIVSPGFDRAIVERCQSLNVPVLPGVATATEIQNARRAGVRVVKFFPAETSGGLPALTALAAPFGDIRFLPTGGITPANAEGYLRNLCVLAVGGSWMVPRDLIAAGNWQEITRLSRNAVDLVAACRSLNTRA
jgi:2-dehydro-3-deoxyphosphogluconate aldolase/(4S)-4-hydroxy-2-oxoglutarate aldolase